MTAEEIISIKMKVMNMALEIYRLERHGAFNGGQTLTSSIDISVIYDKLYKKLNLEEFI